MALYGDEEDELYRPSADNTNVQRGNRRELQPAQGKIPIPYKGLNLPPGPQPGTAEYSFDPITDLMIPSGVVAKMLAKGGAKVAANTARSAMKSQGALPANTRKLIQKRHVSETPQELDLLKSQHTMELDMLDAVKNNPYILDDAVASRALKHGEYKAARKIVDDADDFMRDIAQTGVDDYKINWQPKDAHDIADYYTDLIKGKFVPNANKAQNILDRHKYLAGRDGILTAAEKTYEWLGDFSQKGFKKLSNREAYKRIPPGINSSVGLLGVAGASLYSGL